MTKWASYCFGGRAWGYVAGFARLLVPSARARHRHGTRCTAMRSDPAREHGPGMRLPPLLAAGASTTESTLPACSGQRAS